MEPAHPRAHDPVSTTTTAAANPAALEADAWLVVRSVFLRAHGWELVINRNRRACEAASAQHGLNPATQAQVAAEWRQRQECTLTWCESVDFLRECRSRSPFLFFNGDTFAEIGREIAQSAFGHLDPARLHEVSHAITRYIGDLMERQAMLQIVGRMARRGEPKPGDRVQTLCGTRSGSVTRRLADGRIVWRPDGSLTELIALPEGLLAAEP